MRSISRILRNTLSVLLLLALAAGAVWLITQSRPRPAPAAPVQQSPLATPTQPPSIPLVPSPTPTQAAPPTQLTPTQSAANLDNYVFGEPQVVLTHTAAIGIVGWLPGDKELLLTLRQPGTTTENIETFNVITGERHVYGNRHGIDVPPIWLEAVGRVAFTTLAGQEIDLWISGHGDALAHEPTLRNVNWAITGLQDRVILLDRDERRLVLTNETGQSVQTVPVDLYALGFDPDNSLSHFRMASHPSRQMVALYDSTHFVIVNQETGKLLQIDLGRTASEDLGYGPRWAYHARWSPDGRRLALLTTVGEPIVSSTELTVVNTESGISSQIPLGTRYVYDIAWAPTGHHLVALGQASMVEGRTLVGLYLVDVLTGETRRMLPNEHVELEASAQAVRWSVGGQALALLCPHRLQEEPPRGESRLCLLKVDD